MEIAEKLRGGKNQSKNGGRKTPQDWRPCRRSCLNDPKAPPLRGAVVAAECIFPAPSGSAFASPHFRGQKCHPKLIAKQMSNLCHLKSA